MGAALQFTEGKTDNALQLPRAIHKIDAIACVALILRVITRVTEGNDDKTGSCKCEGRVVVTRKRPADAVRDEYDRQCGPCNLAVQSNLLLKEPKGLHRNLGIARIPDSSRERLTRRIGDVDLLESDVGGQG